MRTEKSCGAIVFRKNQGNIEFSIVQQKQGGHWFFPEGHVEEGESGEQTALREIYEEIGLQAHIFPGFKEILSYYIDATDVDKTVVLFLCTVASCINYGSGIAGYCMVAVGTSVTDTYSGKF